jgi:hypothetical protein
VLAGFQRLVTARILGREWYWIGPRRELWNASNLAQIEVFDEGETPSEILEMTESFQLATPGFIIQQGI